MNFIGRTQYNIAQAGSMYHASISAGVLVHNEAKAASISAGVLGHNEAKAASISAGVLGHNEAKAACISAGVLGHNEVKAGSVHTYLSLLGPGVLVGEAAAEGALYETQLHFEGLQRGGAVHSHRREDGKVHALPTLGGGGGGGGLRHHCIIMQVPLHQHMTSYRISTSPFCYLPETVSLWMALAWKRWTWQRFFP